MMIPGWIVSMLSFPGVIVQQAIHMLICKWRHIPIMELRFFQTGEPVGCVLHENPKDFLSAFLVCIGPFFVNSILCILLCFPAFIPILGFGEKNPLSYLLIYLGVSIGMHAFPTIRDANNLWEHSKFGLKKANPLVIITFPLVFLLYVAHYLKIMWIDAAYGVALGYLLPKLILESFA
ncbi:MAG: DUF3267 domain-containing protein [bacterium]|nr:DUF3267 domain-containing protein [bacterium]